MMTPDAIQQYSATMRELVRRANNCWKSGDFQQYRILVRDLKYVHGLRVDSMNAFLELTEDLDPILAAKLRDNAHEQGLIIAEYEHRSEVH